MRKNDNVIFIVCLVIAFIFWGLIKLSNSYDVSYDFKVRYSNIPAEKKLTRLVDSTVNVSFTAMGFDILRLNMFENMSQLNIDLESCELISNEGNLYEISTDELKPKLADNIGLSASEIDFSEDALGFILEDLDEKKVRVISKMELSFKQRYDLYEPEVLFPEEVTVFGPKDLLDTLNLVYTEKVQLINLNTDQTVKVKIKNPNPKLLKFEPNEVSISLRIEQYTESSIELPIDFSGIKDDIKTFPSTVKVSFKVAQKDFNNVKAGQFLVIPETQDIDLNEVDKIHLSIARKPDFIRDERLIPAYVEFLIIK